MEFIYIFNYVVLSTIFQWKKGGFEWHGYCGSWSAACRYELWSCTLSVETTGGPRNGQGFMVESMHVVGSGSSANSFAHINSTSSVEVQADIWALWKTGLFLIRTAAGRNEYCAWRGCDDCKPAGCWATAWLRLLPSVAEDVVVWRFSDRHT